MNKIGSSFCNGCEHLKSTGQISSNSCEETNFYCEKQEDVYGCKHQVYYELGKVNKDGKIPKPSNCPLKNH